MAGDDDLKARIRELESQKQELTREVGHLRAVNAKQAHLINTHESIHGKLFTCFPRLPPELRRRIWQLTIYPRILEAEETPISGDPTPKRWGAPSIPDPPIISRVCKESRDLFLEQYVVFSDRIPGHMKSAYGHDGPRYFNPLLDTIFITRLSRGGPRAFTDSLSSLSKHLQNIAPKMTKYWQKWGLRSLALHAYLLPYFDGPEENLEGLSIFDEFQALEEFVLIFQSQSIPSQGLPEGLDNPQSEGELCLWEEQMEDIGLLKARAGNKYAKWANLRVTAAINRTKRKNTIDQRGNLRMFGPAGCHIDWDDWEADESSFFETDTDTEEEDE